MSRLRIIHETTYRYRSPVTFGPHRLVLRPREGHDVRLESMDLTVTPAQDTRWSRDLFNNTIATLTFRAPGDLLHIRSEVVVERRVYGATELDRLPAEVYTGSRAHYLGLEVQVKIQPA